MNNRRTAAAHPRALLLLPAGLSLLAGLGAAFGLLGLPIAVVPGRWEEVHGPLMVLAFVGTVIALERAVALRALPGYAAPVLLGAGGLLCLSPAPLALAQGALLAGTLALLAVYSRLWRRAGSLPLVVEILGAVCGAGAAALWLVGVAVPFLAPWLVGFLVLTVLGERLELGAVGSALAAPGSTPRGHLAATWGAALYVLACAVALVLPGPGYPLLGATLLALVVVVGTNDVARRTIRTTGLTRYMAAAMLAGYGWLIVAGLVWFVGGGVFQGRWYDASLHAVFLGFVLSMIMAHAPVILPAVIRRPLPYRPLLYVPLVLLHVSLLVRVLAGDVWDLPLAVQIGGVGNIAALLLFVACALGSVIARPPLPRSPRVTTATDAVGHPAPPVEVAP